MLSKKTLRAEFDALLADRRSALGARTLATLIALGALEIKLAERTNGKGIYHEKVGYYSRIAERTPSASKAQQMRLGAGGTTRETLNPSKFSVAGAADWRHSALSVTWFILQICGAKRTHMFA